MYRDPGLRCVDGLVWGDRVMIRPHCLSPADVPERPSVVEQFGTYLEARGRREHLDLQSWEPRASCGCDGTLSDPASPLWVPTGSPELQVISECRQVLPARSLWVPTGSPCRFSVRAFRFSQQVLCEYRQVLPSGSLWIPTGSPCMFSVST